MQQPFQPSPDSTSAYIDLQELACLATNLDVADIETRMVRVDSVYLDFASDRLYVSFYEPCTENAIRSRLVKAGYGVKEQETRLLTVEEGVVQEAISA